MAIDTESFDLLLASVQRFITERLVPAENAVEENDEVPADIVEDMKEMGLFGLSIPEEYGGIGLSMSQECRVAFELGQTALAFRSVFGTNVGIGSQGILMDGTEAQKREFLPRVASGELIMSFALTEPDAGSDSAAVKTRAELVKDGDGDHYLLNGTKRFITNAPRAGVFTLMARTGGPGAGGISAFVVPADAKGLSLGKPDKKMGQRGTKTCDVILDNVRVPAAGIIGGKPGQGFKTAMKVLDRGPPAHFGGGLRHGAAHPERIRGLRARAQAVRQAHRRLPTDPGDARRQPGRALCRLVAWCRTARCAMTPGPPGKTDSEVSMRASCAKLFCTEMVGRVADRGVQVHGGSGYINEYPVERFYRDVRLLRLYEGTTQIQQLIIGRELVGRD